MKLRIAFIALLGVQQAPPAVGVVVHAVTSTDMARLSALGVRDLRVTVYVNMPLDSAKATLDSVVNPLHDVLAVVNGQPARWTPDSVIAYVKRLAPPGLPNATPPSWIRAAVAAGLGASGVLCLHAYGDPIAVGLSRMMAAADSAGWRGPVWVTELGYVNGDPAKQAAQLRDALDVRGAARVYVYALWSDADHYGLTTGRGRRELPAFAVVRAAARR